MIISARKRGGSSTRSKQAGFRQQARSQLPSAKSWPFTDDELAIAPDATWEQVKAALELVGNADEFERLRDEALRLCGVPEERVSDHPIIDHDEAMVEIRAAMQEARRAHGSSQRVDASSVTTH